jgi:excisionase family DNA binding protein
MAALLEQTITPTEDDQRLASVSSRLMESFVAPPHQVRIQFIDEPQPSNILSLPAAAMQLLNEILKEMAKGNAVAVTPIHAALTTQEAADLLNVSRPFLIGLLEAGKIPYQRLGSHRRILFKDLMAFKEKTDAASDEAFRQLVEEAQELNMGY